MWEISERFPMPASERNKITTPAIGATPQAAQQEHSPEFVARVRKAASEPLPETFSADQMMEHVRRLVGGNAQAE